MRELKLFERNSLVEKKEQGSMEGRRARIKLDLTTWALEGVEVGPGRDGKEIETKKWKFLPKKLLPMEQVVRLTTRSDRLGSLDGLVRQHSILPPRFHQPCQIRNGLCNLPGRLA